MTAHRAETLRAALADVRRYLQWQLRRSVRKHAGETGVMLVHQFPPFTLQLSRLGAARVEVRVGRVKNERGLGWLPKKPKRRNPAPAAAALSEDDV